MRVTVMDRELHEPLTIVNVPNHMVPDPRINPMGGYMPHRIFFNVPAPTPFYETRIISEPMQQLSRATSIVLEPVMRHTGTSPTNYNREIIFWYAYADEPELALLLRAAFLPGQVGEMQMREHEARIEGMFRGVGIGIEIGRRFG